MGFSLSDQELGSVAGLLALFHDAQRRLSHLLRSDLYLRRQHGAAEKMCADGFGEFPMTPRAHVRAVPADHLCGEVCVAVADVANRAPRDDVPRAVDEDQHPLFRCQGVRSLAVAMRQPCVVRLDDVSKRDWPRALRAVHRHVTPHWGQSNVDTGTPSEDSRWGETAIGHSPYAVGHA